MTHLEWNIWLIGTLLVDAAAYKAGGVTALIGALGFCLLLASLLAGLQRK